MRLGEEEGNEGIFNGDVDNHKFLEVMYTIMKKPPNEMLNNTCKM